MLKLLQYSFRILTVSFLLFFLDNLYNFITLSLLLSLDIISSIFPSFYFQIIFLIFFFIGFLNLFYINNYIYTILFFFYSLYQSIYYILFYNFIFFPTENNKEILDYLENLNTVFNEEEECFICLENLKEKNGLKYLNCSHIFHPSCLLEWFNSQNIKNYICPLCKENIFIEKYISV